MAVSPGEEKLHALEPKGPSHLPPIKNLYQPSSRTARSLTRGHRHLNILCEASQAQTPLSSCSLDYSQIQWKLHLHSMLHLHGSHTPMAQAAEQTLGITLHCISRPGSLPYHTLHDLTRDVAESPSTSDTGRGNLSAWNHHQNPPFHWESSKKARTSCRWAFLRLPDSRQIVAGEAQKKNRRDGTNVRRKKSEGESPSSLPHPAKDAHTPFRPDIRARRP